MKAPSVVFRILLLLIFVTTLLQSQTIALRGSSAIELDLGFWNNVNAGQQNNLPGVKQEAKESGFVGGLTYCYWMRENLAITVAASLLSSEASSIVSVEGGTIVNPVITVRQNTNALFSFLVGTRYFIPEPDPEDIVRPYLSIGVGSFMGFEASNSLLAQSAHSESTFGGRAGVGLDAHLGKSVKLGVNAGYNAMLDFGSVVGARNNFNGFDFSVGIAFLFGGQR
ncbi:MAG: outer membrane beta-barrel protein [Ignavibacteria bacterium]|nr:outer membrane beta-barrel protein [Ignavibacteria bacterium]